MACARILDCDTHRWGSIPAGTLPHIICICRVSAADVSFILKLAVPLSSSLDRNTQSPVARAIRLGESLEACGHWSFSVDALFEDVHKGSL